VPVRSINLYLKELSQVELLEPAKESLLWQRYKEEQDGPSRTRLIESYQPLVFKLMMRLGAQDDQLMDLIQEGTVGLIEAVEAFNPKRGVHFSTYAKHRIRGRMLNYLAAKNQNVSTLDEYRHQLEDLETKSGQEIMEECELTNRVAQALSRLPSRERAVVRAVYLQEEQPQKVAQNMQISASYLYKLQKRAVRRLRGMLSSFIAEVKTG